MEGELNKDYYCAASGASDCQERGECSFCPDAHRKWPTPEQFKKEYGNDFPDDGIGYWTYLGSEVWKATSFADFKNYISSSINTAIRNPIFVCACTPWGSPPNDYRPN